MYGASFDRSKKLPLYARIGEVGDPVILIFTDENGDPVNLSGLNFELPVKKRSFSESAEFTLTMGDGLSIIGDDSNQLKIELTEARSNQIASTYFWPLKELTENRTWLNGTWVFHNGLFDGINEDFEIINSMDIRITLSNGSTEGLMRIQGVWDASADLLPSTNVLKGYWWKISVAGAPGGYSLPVGAKIMALENAPGQDLTKWDITE